MTQEYKPREFLGYLVSRAMKGMSVRLAENFEELGYPIGRAEWLILAKTYHLPCEKLLQCEMVEIMLGDKTSVTRAVDDLVKRGWLVREIDENDRRNRLLSLTDAGREVVPILKEAVKKTIAEASENVSEEEMKITKKVLAQIIDNFNQLNK